MMTCKCGYRRYTRPDALLCAACEKQRRYEYHCAEWQEELELLGYDILQFEITKGSHSKIEVTNRDCGHAFVAKLNNILAGKTVCGHCGPTKRAANALKHYVAKHGRTYDFAIWRDYRDKVRKMSDAYYHLNEATLNPHKYNRSRPDLDPNAVQLDHLISIIYGFKNNLSPEMIADPLNLRVIPAKTNLSKHKKLTKEAEDLLTQLKEKYEEFTFNLTNDYFCDSQRC